MTERYHDAGEGHSKDGDEKPFTPSDLYRVGVRLPPFWREDPAIWFRQIECNFAISAIKDDETKYNYVIAQLENRYAAEVRDIIVSPPPKNKYETLKTELIKRLSASREKEVKQLLIHEELGDRRPSQFLRHLQHLAGTDVPVDFLRTIWTSRLPSNLQTIIASQPGMNLQALADLADKVHELAPATAQVASADVVPSTTLDEMARQIAELTRQVKTLTARDHRRSRSQTRDNKRERSNTRTQSNYRKFPTCFYHYKFGKDARKCSPPCDFNKGNFQGSH